MKKKPIYQPHEKMGEGDPLKMAGLPMQPKGGLSKTKRNKKIYKGRKRNWEMTGDRDFFRGKFSDKGWP